MEWWGDTTISKTEDYKFGFYDATTVSWDRIALNAPYYLIVKSGGNSHGSDGPGAGQPYYIGTSNRTSTLARKDQDGYDQISTYGNAKNILAVGAVGNLNYGYNQAGDVPLSDFTSWGPTDDGRIKPDIAGIGVGILSSSSESDSAYVVYDGTSMASPNVAGTLLLCRNCIRNATAASLCVHRR